MKVDSKKFRCTLFVKFLLFILYVPVIFGAVWIVDRPEAEQAMRRWPAACFAHLLLFCLLSQWGAGWKPGQSAQGWLIAYRIAMGTNELLFLALGCLIIAQISVFVPFPILVWVVPVIHVVCTIWSIHTWTNREK